MSATSTDSPPGPSPLADLPVRFPYHDDSGPGTLETSFSVAKSLVSTLVGIAIDQGRIGSVDDPVTRYVPELAARDRRFEQITPPDLLMMSSRLRYEESSLPSPRGDDTSTSCGVDLRKDALERTEIEQAPGTRWHYNNSNPCSSAWCSSAHRNVGLGLHGEPALAAAGSRQRCQLAPGLRALGVREDGEWPQRHRAQPCPLRPALAARRPLEPTAHRLAGMGPRRYPQPDGDRLPQPLRVLVVDRRQRPDRFYALGNYGWGFGNEAWLATFHAPSPTNSRVELDSDTANPGAPVRPHGGRAGCQGAGLKAYHHPDCWAHAAMPPCRQGQRLAN